MVSPVQAYLIIARCCHLHVIKDKSPAGIPRSSSRQAEARHYDDSFLFTIMHSGFTCARTC